MIASPLQLDRYFVDVLAIETIDEYNDSAGILDVEIAVDPEALRRDDDRFAHQLVLDVTFRPAEPNSAPYSGRIVGRAYFRVSEGVSDDDMQRLVLLNGASILLGLLRAQVTQVTALGRHGPFLLPPLNLREAFARKAKARPKASKPKAKAVAKKSATTKASTAGSIAATKANATRTTDARSEASRKANVSRGAAGRSAASKKAAATRAAKKGGKKT